MRKLLLLLAALFCSVVLTNAQERYEVTVKSPLNVRSSASTNGAVLGILPNGSIVDVYEYYGDWAKIKYNDGYAYVSSKYLKKCEVQPEQVQSPKKNKIEAFLSDIDLEQFATYNVKWMVFVILALSIALAILRKLETEYGIYIIVFAVTSILEMIYLLKMGSDRVWFSMPGEVGWGWAIAGFITLGWVSYNQLMCFMDLMSQIRFEEGDFNLSIGLYSWPAAIVAAVVANIFGWEGWYLWIVIILGICQLIQIVMIVIGVEEETGFGNGLLVSAFYLVGAIATVLVLIQFIALLIVVLIVGFLLMGILSGSGSSSGSSSSSSSSSDSNRGSLEYSDRFGSIEGRFSDDNTFHADGGGTYDKQWDGSWKKREW